MTPEQTLAAADHVRSVVEADHRRHDREHRATWLDEQERNLTRESYNIGMLLDRGLPKGLDAQAKKRL